jgi:hypothetical protein
MNKEDKERIALYWKVQDAYALELQEKSNGAMNPKDTNTSTTAKVDSLAKSMAKTKPMSQSEANKAENKEAFLNSMMKNPDFFRRITKQLSHELGIMEDKLTDASQKSIRERLAVLLLQLANTYGVDGGGHQQIDLILTREEIAGMVGTATESVIRLLSEFKKDGLIELDGKKISIKDKKGLIRLSDFYA